jgi:GNAT superfamily N-acetyltransferase
VTDRPTLKKSCCSSCSAGKPCCSEHGHIHKSEGNPNHDASTGQFTSHADVNDHLPSNLKEKGWTLRVHGPDDDGIVSVHAHHPYAGKIGHLNATLKGKHLALFDTRVEDRSKGKGIGRAMFSALYQHAADRGATTVGVPEHSTDAQRLLSRMHGADYQPTENPDAGPRIGAYDFRYQPTTLPLKMAPVKKALDPSDPSRFFDVFEVTRATDLRFKKSSDRKVVRQMTFQGLPISIETDKGRVREWHDEHSGEHGATKMNYPYGYIRRTEGADGDEIDVFIGPEDKSSKVFIIHQRKKPAFTQYDEDKIMLGFESPREAKAAYLEHYDDRRFFGSMTETTLDDFKRIFLTKKAIGDERPDHAYIKREGEPGHYKYTYPGQETAAAAGSGPKEEVEQKLKTTVTLSSDTPQAHSALKAVSKAVAGLAAVVELDNISGLNGVKIGVTKNYDAGGDIFAVYDFDDRTIAVDDSHPETFNHEFGHFLDHMAGGGSKSYFTEQNRGTDWLDAVRSTKSVDLWRTHWRKSRPEFGTYYNKGTEIFARFFDQWVHTKLTEKGLNPEDYHSDFMRLTQEDADKYADFGEPASNEPLIGAKGMFSKEDFEKLRPAFEAIIQPYLKKALETFMQKNMVDPGLVGAPPPPPMPMAPMGMMPPMMGMGPPPTDVETFEGVTALLGRIGTVPDQALMEIASTIWGNGYQFQGQPPDQARQEIIGFLLDQRDLLGIAPVEPSLQPSPSLPAMAPSGSSDYSAVSRTSPVVPTIQPPEANSSGAAGPNQSWMNWFEQDLSRRSA